MWWILSNHGCHPLSNVRGNGYNLCFINTTRSCVSCFQFQTTNDIFSMFINITNEGHFKKEKPEDIIDILIIYMYVCASMGSHKLPKILLNFTVLVYHRYIFVHMYHIIYIAMGLFVQFFPN